MNDELRFYLRMNPKWYLILNRYPYEIDSLNKEYRIVNKKTFNDQLDKINMMLKIVDLLM